MLSTSSSGLTFISTSTGNLNGKPPIEVLICFFELWLEVLMFVSRFKALRISTLSVSKKMSYSGIWTAVLILRDTYLKTFNHKGKAVVDF